MAKTKNKVTYYEYTQNNSGGSFDVNENVSHRVIIEAKSEGEADKKIRELTEDQSSSCPCCGERWSYYPTVLEFPYKYGDITFKKLDEYCMYMCEKYGWEKPDIIVHFANGTKRGFNSLR